MSGGSGSLVVVTVVAAVAGVAAGACGGPSAPAESGVAPAPAKHAPAKSSGEAAAARGGGGESRVAFTVYFANREYVETGNDSLDPMLAERVMFEPALATGGSDRLATAALRALANGPTSAAALPVIPERIRIRSVHVREGIAEIDLARAGLSGGSLEEQLFVASIVRTLTQLPDVSAVRFLVEGQPTETLMGHVSTAQPLSASDY